MNKHRQRPSGLTKCLFKSLQPPANSPIAAWLPCSLQRLVQLLDHARPQLFCGSSLTMPQFEMNLPYLDKLSVQWGDRSGGEKAAIAVAGGAATLALGVLVYRRWAGMHRQPLQAACHLYALAPYASSKGAATGAAPATATQAATHTHQQLFSSRHRPLHSTERERSSASKPGHATQQWHLIFGVRCSLCVQGDG